MLDVINWANGILWKVLGIGLSWVAIKWLLKNATGTMRELLETAGVAIRAECRHLKLKLIQQVAEEELKDQKPEPTVEAEGSVN